MKVLTFNKTYSWLQLPVKLRGCDEASLHITIKFFGHIALNAAAIEKRLDRSSPFTKVETATGFQWKPEKFGELIHVLEFTQFPAALTYMHEMFDFLKDDFEPYRPHVTVPLSYWKRVSVNRLLTPQSEDMRLGELELCIGTADEHD